MPARSGEMTLESSMRAVPRVPLGKHPPKCKVPDGMDARSRIDAGGNRQNEAPVRAYLMRSQGRTGRGQLEGR